MKQTHWERIMCGGDVFLDRDKAPYFLLACSLFTVPFISCFPYRPNSHTMTQNLCTQLHVCCLHDILFTVHISLDTLQDLKRVLSFPPYPGDYLHPVVYVCTAVMLLCLLISIMTYIIHHRYVLNVGV